MKMLIP